MDAERRTIVVGFDQGPASRAALAEAADLGRQLGSRLVVVHVIDLADYPVDPDAEDWEAQAEQVLSAERQQVAAALGDYEPGWSFRFVTADVAHSLVQVADEEGARMIVVGVREHGWTGLIEHLLRASVPQKVVRRSARPVLLVAPHPGGGAPHPGGDAGA